MDWQTGSKILAIAAVIDICASKSISKLMAVSYTRLFMAHKEKNPQEINQGIWEATRPNPPVWKCLICMVTYTFHNEIAPCPDETTCGTKQV